MQETRAECRRADRDYRYTHNSHKLVNNVCQDIGCYNEYTTPILDTRGSISYFKHKRKMQDKTYADESNKPRVGRIQTPYTYKEVKIQPPLRGI